MGDSSHGALDFLFIVVDLPFSYRSYPLNFSYPYSLELIRYNKHAICKSYVQLWIPSLC